jgi:hypothetical protein
MTMFERGDRLKVALAKGLWPADAVVIGHDETERGPDGQVVLRIIAEFDDGTRTILAEDSPLVARASGNEVDGELSGAPDEPVVWRPGTNPHEIAGVLSKYLTGRPDLAAALAVATEQQLAELQTDPRPEQELEVLSKSADALLARLRKDSPFNRDVRASDLVSDDPTPPKNR